MTIEATCELPLLHQRMNENVLDIFSTSFSWHKKLRSYDRSIRDAYDRFKRHIQAESGLGSCIEVVVNVADTCWVHNTRIKLRCGYQFDQSSVVLYFIRCTDEERMRFTYLVLMGCGVNMSSAKDSRIGITSDTSSTALIVH